MLSREIHVQLKALPGCHDGGPLTTDRSSLSRTVDGRRRILISGSIHYTRIL